MLVSFFWFFTSLRKDFLVLFIFFNWVNWPTSLVEDSRLELFAKYASDTEAPNPGLVTINPYCTMHLYQACSSLFTPFHSFNHGMKSASSRISVWNLLISDTGVGTVQMTSMIPALLKSSILLRVIFSMTCSNSHVDIMLVVYLSGEGCYF